MRFSLCMRYCFRIFTQFRGVLGLQNDMNEQETDADSSMAPRHTKILRTGNYKNSECVESQVPALIMTITAESMTDCCSNDDNVTQFALKWTCGAVLNRYAVTGVGWWGGPQSNEKQYAEAFF